MQKWVAGLFVLLLATSVFATEFGVTIEKSVNGAWKEAIVINHSVGFWYPKAYLNTEMVFSAPRANMLKPDHEYLEVITGAKFSILNEGVLDINIGVRQNLQGQGTSYSNGVSLMWRL